MIRTRCMISDPPEVLLTILFNASIVVLKPPMILSFPAPQHSQIKSYVNEGQNE